MKLLQHCGVECYNMWLVLCVLTLVTSVTNAVHLQGNETDRASLLAVKAALVGYGFRNMLNYWNHSSHFCKWHGVTCGRRHRRVIALDLPASGLTGTISPYIGNLSFLRRVNLPENKLQGHLPDELGHLTRLRGLNLSYNLIQGTIPANLSQCFNLRGIDLSRNRLVGKFPVELTRLPKLIILLFTSNNLSGTILPALANLSSLEYLLFGDNSLMGGIPYELGRLQRLTRLHLAFNFLSGTIPSSIYNLSSLEILSLSINHLHGSLPPNLGLQLPNLQKLLLGKIGFAGPLPVTLCNASGLVDIMLAGNSFIGKIPSNLGKLQRLTSLQLSNNQLTEDDIDLTVITSLTNCTRLSTLSLDGNLLTARLPESTSNLSAHLQWMVLGGNNIFGKIPIGIGNLVGLELLVFQVNNLIGNIPHGMWTLPRLHILGLAGNKLSGKIPSSFCNSSQLVILALGGNNLEGHTPTTIGQCDQLQMLDLSENQFSGTIPMEVFTLPSLSIYLGFSFNFLSGPLPSEVGNMKTLATFRADHNNFSGKIPIELGHCCSLNELNLGNNAFQGVIPTSFSFLSSLEKLDLSHNNLSGPIPAFIKNFKYLKFLDLSSNNFKGEVPNGGIFLNSSAISLSGNHRICGGPSNLHLLSCPKKDIGKIRRSSHLRVVISIICSSIVVLLMASIVVVYCKRKPSKVRSSLKDPLEGKYWRVSYQDLLKATNGFSTDCLIGSGRYGSVFKATFEEGITIAAVKVFNLQIQGSSRTFAIECKALRRIRHGNLVKILTSCASVDHRGNEFKAIVFEYMTNGSLHEWLQDNEGSNQISKMQRLRIAIDVATALDYLHNQCEKPIVHCDLKSQVIFF